MAVIGQLKLDPGARGGIAVEDLYGLPIVRTWADPEGWLGPRRLRKAGRALRRGGVLRALAPTGFERWDLLAEHGLIPVDPVAFLRAQSAPLALGVLERQGMAPDRATVALRGLRADREMVRAAVALCPQVRRLVVSAPRGGDELAAWLRWEFGVPILPEGEEVQVALRFHPAGERQEGRTLDLYGPAPSLSGLTVSAPRLAEEDRDQLPLLAALWEGGRLGGEDLKIT